jgi:chromosomal replication initiator protein
LQRLLRGCDLAEAAGQFNPLVLVGPSGSGKSQLARAITRRWSSVLGTSQTAYLSAADFGRELQAAAALDRLAAWRRDQRGLRMLVLEDLDRLRLNATIQQELRATLDAVIDSGGVAVVTAKREPATLTQLDAGLCDRLVAGLTIRLQRPGLAARRSIVRLAAGVKRVPLTDDEVAGLCHSEVAAPAELIGQVQRLHPGLRPQEGSDPAINHAPQFPQRCGTARPRAACEPVAIGAPATPTLKQIIAVSARYFGVTQAALTGPSRRSSLVHARNIVVHLARRLTDLSYADIGRGLGGRDHTTTMHGERRITEQLDRDPSTQQTLEALDRLLR